MTRKEAIKIMKRWDAPGYAFDDGHEFGELVKAGPRWWAALVRADAEVQHLLDATRAATTRGLPLTRERAPYVPRLIDE